MSAVTRRAYKIQVKKAEKDEGHSTSMATPTSLSAPITISSSPVSRSATKSEQPIAIKREPGTTAGPSPKRQRKGKAPFAKTRSQRIAEMRKKNAVAVDILERLIPDDFRALADTLLADAPAEAIYGVMHMGMRRLMVRLMWLEPEFRRVGARIMVPDNVSETELSGYVAAFGKAYHYQSKKFRNKADVVCHDLLGALREGAIADGMTPEEVEAWIAKTLSSHENFIAAVALYPEDIENLWSFAAPAVAKGILKAPTDGKEPGFWFRFVEGWTTRYIRNRCEQLFMCGGASSSQAGLDIMKKRELQDFVTIFMKGAPGGIEVPPLPHPDDLPKTMAAWKTFNLSNGQENIVKVAEKIVKETYKATPIPEIPNMDALKEEVEAAEVFSEEEFEDLYDGVDMTKFIDTAEPLPELQFPPDGMFGEMKTRGDILASLSTTGLLQYAAMRHEREMEYLAQVIQYLKQRIEEIENTRNRIKEVIEERETRKALLRKMEEDAKSLTLKLLDETTAARNANTSTFGAPVFGGYTSNGSGLGNIFKGKIGLTSTLRPLMTLSGTTLGGNRSSMPAAATPTAQSPKATKDSFEQATCSVNSGHAGMSVRENREQNTPNRSEEKEGAGRDNEEEEENDDEEEFGSTLGDSDGDQ